MCRARELCADKYGHSGRAVVWNFESCLIRIVLCVCVCTRAPYVSVADRLNARIRWRCHTLAIKTSILAGRLLIDNISTVNIHSSQEYQFHYWPGRWHSAGKNDPNRRVCPTQLRRNFRSVYIGWAHAAAISFRTLAEQWMAACRVLCAATIINGRFVYQYLHRRRATPNTHIS